MGSHLGWHFAVGCPLRGGREKYKQYTVGPSIPPIKIKGENKIHL
jgi:hypothetical protein